MSTAPPLGEVYAKDAKIVPFSTVLTTGLLYFLIWLTTLSLLAARREERRLPPFGGTAEPARKRRR